jgi:hypothetical protein
MNASLQEKRKRNILGETWERENKTVDPAQS